MPRTGKKRTVGERMLNNCSSLIECEKALVEPVGRVEFIGQIELSKEEVLKLSALVKERLKDNLPQGVKYLTENTPATLACYLVGHGIHFYNEGDYWTTLADFVGLNEPNWQTRVGQKFIDFLKQRQKPVIEIPEAHKYVANILLHGGIPQSCLYEYFDQLIQPVVMGDLIDKDDVKAYLSDLRALENKNHKLVRVNQKLKEEQIQLQKKQARVEKLLKIKKEDYELQRQLGFLQGLAVELPDDYEKTRKRLLMELAVIQSKQTTINEQISECLGAIENYDQEDSLIVRAAGVVEELMRVYREELSEVEKSITCLWEKSQWSIEKLQCCLREMEAERSDPDQFEAMLEEICWVELLASLDEGAKLWDRLSEKEKEISSIDPKPVRLSLLFWPSLPLLIAGAIFSVVLPSRPILWLIPAAGLTLLGLAWHRCLLDNRLATQRARRLKIITQEFVQLQLPMSELRAKVYRLAGNLYTPGVSFWGKPFGEIKAIVNTLCKEYAEYLDITDRLTKAEKRLRTWKQSVAETAATFTPGSLDLDGENLEKTLSYVQRSINEAFDKKQQAEEAESRLGDYKEELNGLEAERENIQEKINKLDQALCILGDGDLQRGAELLSQIRLRRSRIKELQRELTVEEEQGFTDELQAHSLEELLTLFRKLKSLCEEKTREFLRSESALQSVSRPLLYLDKPIRRFILYGKEWAGEWLYESVLLTAQTMAGKALPMSTGQSLPSRVVDAFFRWWDDRQSKSTGISVAQGLTRTRILSPELKLDRAGSPCIYLPRQRFKLSGLNEAWVEISHITDERKIVRHPLKVYLQEADLGESEPAIFPVSQLGGTIELTLGLGNEVLRTWQIPISINGLPFLIFDENGSVVSGEPLLRERVWFLLPMGYYIRPMVRPLEENSAQLSEPCRLQLVDLKTINEDLLCIVDKEGVGHSFTLSEDALMTPRLEGQRIAGVVVDDNNPLYLKGSVMVLLPQEVCDGMDEWKVYSRPRAGYPGEEKKCLLSELVLPEQDELALSLPLDQASLLGEEPCGRYTVTLLSPEKHKYRFDVIFISEFESVFSSALYIPDGEKKPVELSVRCPKGFSFQVNSPAKLQKVLNNKFMVSTEQSAGYVSGKLSWSTSGNVLVTLPLSIEVPRLRWRIEGLSDGLHALWSQGVGEIWIGDWSDAEKLCLFIAVPFYLKGCIQLFIEGTEQKYEAEIKQGLVQFNLLPFTDTLKARSGLPSFRLAIRSRETNEIIANSLLFRVRAAWTVEDIAFRQKKSKGMRYLAVSWRDLGKAGSRTLRLWDKNRPWLEPVKQFPIPDGVSKMDIRVKAEELPAGSYVLEFALIDPWSSSHTKPVFPGNVTNIAVAEILDTPVNITWWEARWLDDNKLQVRGKVSGGGDGLPIKIKIIGRKKRDWFYSSCRTSTGVSGLFQATVTAQKKVSHWIGIKALTEPAAYIYSVIPEPAPLYFYLDNETRLAMQLGGCDIATMKLAEAKDFQHDILLSASNGVSIVKALQEGRNEAFFTFQLADGTSKEARLEFDAAQKKITIKLKSGALCTGCGKLLPNTAAWYKHSSILESPSCKSFIPNYSTIKARLMVIWDIWPWLQKVSNALPIIKWIPLFDSKSANLGDDLPEARKDIQGLALKLLAQEKKWIQLMSQAGFYKRKEDYHEYRSYKSY